MYPMAVVESAGVTVANQKWTVVNTYILKVGYPCLKKKN